MQTFYCKHSIANILLQTVILFGLLATSKAEDLPDFLPKSAIELKSDTKLLVSPAGSIEEVKLNSLETGKHYFIRLRFVNMLGASTSITEIESSCGCMVAAINKQVVEHKSESFFFVYIKPQLKSGPYGKTVTVTFNTGVKVMVLLTASFESPFSLDIESVVLGDETKTIKLSGKINIKEYESRDVDFVTQMGYLNICQPDVPVGHNEVFELSLDVEDATHKNVSVAGSLVEVIQVVDRPSKSVICLLPISLTSDVAFRCKPSRLVMRKDGDKYKGEVLVFGEWEQYISKDMTLRLQDLNRDVPLDVGVTLKWMKNKVAKIELLAEGTDSFFKDSRFAIMNCESRLGVLDSIAFEGE